MSAWSTDIKSAPHGRYEIKQRREGVDIRVFVPERVILTTKCGKVTISHYQPGVKRWEMLADGELPVAWMPYEPGQKLPEYPHSLLSAPGAMNSPTRTTSSPSSSGTQFNSQAKASEDNGGIGAVGSVPMTGEASRASVGAGTDAFNPEFGSRAETHNSHHVGRVSDAQCQGAVAAQASNSHSLPVPQSQAARPDALPLAASGHLHSDTAGAA